MGASASSLIVACEPGALADSFSARPQRRQIADGATTPHAFPFNFHCAWRIFQSMNAILKPVLLIATSSPGRRGRGATNRTSTSRYPVIDLSYPKARTALIEAGFQPLIDWDRMQHDYDLAEAWIDHANYFEIQACSNTSAGPCRGNFVDSYRNLLRIITEDPSAVDRRLPTPSLSAAPMPPTSSGLRRTGFFAPAPADRPEAARQPHPWTAQQFDRFWGFPKQIPPLKAVHRVSRVA